MIYSDWELAKGAGYEQNIKKNENRRGHLNYAAPRSN